MTDYIKQVAEAVRKAIAEEVAGAAVCNCCWEAVDVPEYCWELAMAIDLGAIITSVPKPEPMAYLTYKGYLLHAGDPKVNEHSDPEPLYAVPPDAQAEVAALRSRVNLGQRYCNMQSEELAAFKAEIDRLKAELEHSREGAQKC